MIEASFFDLNTGNAELNWGPIATRAGFSAKQLASELSRLSLPRLDEFLSYYYTLKGEKREMAPMEGKFDVELKNGQSVLAMCKDQMVYYLPEQKAEGDE
jgi:hypothetical protein